MTTQTKILDRDLFHKVYGIFAAAASNINHTEARKIQRALAFKHEPFFVVLSTATVYATDGLPYDSAVRLTSDELEELVARLGVFCDAAKTGDQIEFAAACQLAAVSGWVSVDRD